MSGPSRSTLLQRCRPAHPHSGKMECNETGAGSRLVANGALAGAAWEVLEEVLDLVERVVLAATNNCLGT